MADIVITEFMDDAVAAELARTHDVLYDPALVDQPEALARAARTALALIVRNRTRVDEPLLAQCERLKVVGRLGVGLERIDIPACHRRGIVVCPARGANAIGVTEYTITAVMMLLRAAYFATGRMLRGEWPRQSLIGLESAGRLLGLLGFGDIARHAARRARALGMRVAAHDPYVHPDDPAWRELGVERMDFASLIESADALSLHVPYTSETRYLIDARALARMKRGAVLVNTTRGGIVDEEALVAALKSGHLGGAALDVFEHEPLTAEHARKFAGAPNLILTPHIAGVSREANYWISVMTVTSVVRVLNGEEPLARA